MNRTEARKEAHRAVAALVAVNMFIEGSDLYAGLDDELPAADLERINRELTNIVGEHLRRGR